MSVTGYGRRGRRSGESEAVDTRQAILEAAKERFLHYGFRKTTVDEIAADAGVGKGTVYLYFNGKEEILLTLIHAVKSNITEQMRVLAQSVASPEDKLRRMVLASILTVYEACMSSPHGNEIVLEDLRPFLHKQTALLDRFKAETSQQMSLIAEVLRTGNRQGLFGVADAEKTAHLVMAAFAAFFPPYDCPAFPNTRSRRELEQGAHEMLDLLIGGLRPDKS